MQVTAEHLIAELKDQMFARWLAEKQAQLAAAENERLRARLDQGDDHPPDQAGGTDAG